MPLLPHAYDRPAASQGEVLQDRCWKTFDEIRFAQPQTSIAVRVVERDPAHPVLRVMIRLPEGHHARVEATGGSLTGADGDARPITFDGAHADERVDGPRLPLPARLDGRTLAAGPTPVASNWWLFVALDRSPGDAFTVTLPSISIDDAVVALPPIRFVRTTDVQAVAPLQC